MNPDDSTLENSISNDSTTKNSTTENFEDKNTATQTPVLEENAEVDNSQKHTFTNEELKTLLLIAFDDSKVNAYVSIRSFKDVDNSADNVKAIYNFLEIMGFKSINVENIKDLLEQKISRKEYLIATGKEAIDGEDAKIIYHFKVNANLPDFQEDETGKIDFREMKLIDSVSAGQLLAEVVMETDGEPGYDIFGKELKQKKGRRQRVKVGKNVILSEDGLNAYATHGGCPVIVGGRIMVDEVYNVSGNVNFSTGNIYFTGDVNIAGKVEEGFKVKAEGVIRVRKEVEKGTLISDSDIEIAGSVIGKEDAFIKSGKNVIFDFIENGRVEADGNIEIRKYTLNSYIDAKRKVFVKNISPKAIVGGCVRSCKGIETTYAGTPTSGVTTKLELYMDNDVVQHMLTIKNKIIEAENEHNEEELQSLNKRLATVQEELDSMKIAAIKISGQIFPGVIIKIHNKIFNVQERLTKVSFFLNKDDGQVGMRSI